MIKGGEETNQANNNTKNYSYSSVSFNTIAFCNLQQSNCHLFLSHLVKNSLPLFVMKWKMILSLGFQ